MALGQRIAKGEGPHQATARKGNGVGGGDVEYKDGGSRGWLCKSLTNRRSESELVVRFALSFSFSFFFSFLSSFFTTPKSAEEPNTEISKSE